jgi:imidazolonepropionase-like amidohydrolase
MSPPSPRRLILKQGIVIEGNGKPARPNGAVVVEGNTITRVIPAGVPWEAQASDQVIDASGKYIMPGIIDGHVHLSSHQGALPGVRHTSTPEYAAVWTSRIVGQILRAGVTGISVPGGKWFVDATVRDAIAGGLVEGPRVFCAGRALTPHGGIFDNSSPVTPAGTDDSVGVLCNTLDDFVRETRRQCARGVNMIKIADSYWGDTQTVSLAELRAVVDEAHRRGVVVTIHSRGSGSTRDAALAGVDWIYHADLATDEDLDTVAKTGTPIMPVFTQCQVIAEQDESKGFTSQMKARVQAQLDQSFEAIRKARRLGITLLSGTDSGNAAAFNYGKYHGREAELLVREIGLTPLEAITACTSLNARTIGLEGKVGVVAEGMLADLIVWNKDPVADIAVLQHPEWLAAVIKDGRVIDRSTEGFRTLASEPPRANVSAQG